MSQNFWIHSLLGQLFESIMCIVQILIVLNVVLAPGLTVSNVTDFRSYAGFGKFKNLKYFFLNMAN